MLVEARRRAGRDDVRVLHHRRAVRQREHLLEAVRDVNYRHTLVAERPEHAQQERDLVLGQRRGGLVEDEQLHVADERAPDHHEPLIRGRQRCGGTAQIPLEPDPLADGLCRTHHLPPAHPPEPGRVVPDEHVLGRAEGGRQRELLGNHLDPEPHGMSRRLVAHRLPLPEEIAAVRLVLAGDDLRQRRLAGAVLADEPENLRPADVDRDVVEGDDARELLAQAPGFEERWAASVRPGLGHRP